MKMTLRPLLLIALAAGFSALVLGSARAGGSHFFPPVSEPLVREECGSCHLAFAPSMLPAASWRKMMGELDRHFGEDATVDPEIARKITAWLVANAGDSGGSRYGAKLLRGVDAGAAPQRITGLPKWVREHREVPDWEWRHKEVRSKANCVACHADAERGYYED